MFLLDDVITYIRRIIKTPSNAQITDALLIDYINRFWITDVDARLQLFDLKTKYQFQTAPGVDKYNMPLYTVQSQTPNQPGAPDIAMYPVYQGFLEPVFVNGVRVNFQTQKDMFNNAFPNIVQNVQVGIGNGSAGPYTLQVPIISNIQPNPLNPPLQGLLRGHIDLAGIMSTGINVDPPQVSAADILALVPFIELMPVTSVESRVYFTATAADGSNIVVADSGQFLQGNVNYGLLMEPGPAPFGNLPLAGPAPIYSTTQNTINYFTGTATNVYFPQVIPNGANINVQCYLFNTGLPRSILYYNNTLTLRSPPDRQYLVELDAYLSPCAFFSQEQSLPFGYMAEYIARGAARKILSDTGDVEQFQFYEPLFKEQETLVWKRSQRQWTATRTETIYSQGSGHGYGNFYNNGNFGN